jgi:hypothetical protein
MTRQTPEGVIYFRLLDDGENRGSGEGNVVCRPCC